MSALDASFWQLENDNASLHVASATIFEGPVPEVAGMREFYEQRLHLIPRYRQRMRTVPLALGRPVWIDDASFDLNYHLRRTALPTPGSTEQLWELMGRVMSQPLERDRPLWEAWVVEGLTDGRWALVSKIHHSIIDGVAGMDLLSTMLDSAPDAEPVVAETWRPDPEPSAVTIVTSALHDLVTAAVRAGRGLGSAGTHPRRAAATLATSTAGLSRYARSARPTRRSSLSGTIGGPRRYRAFELDVAQLANIRASLGGSINDIVLALVSRGFRDLLIARGERATRRTVRCLVPVSVREPDAHGMWDNRISALLLDLPVDIEDPRDILRAVTDRMRVLKASQEVSAGQALIHAADFVPPPMLTAALHAAFRFPQRSLTTVVTNVPGPRRPLYLLGRLMLANYPYVPIADRVRVGIAVTSYAGKVFVGITSDRRSFPDVEVLATGLRGALAELTTVAAQSHVGGC